MDVPKVLQLITIKLPPTQDGAPAMDLEVWIAPEQYEKVVRRSFNIIRYWPEDADLSGKSDA